MREIKFRAWDLEKKIMLKPFDLSSNPKYWCDNLKDYPLMQYTGLKDKNGLQEVYEGDIIDIYGNIKGNIYEVDKGKDDFIIQGFGDKNWGATYKEAVERGCKDAK